MQKMIIKEKNARYNSVREHTKNTVYLTVIFGHSLFPAYVNIMYIRTNRTVNRIVFITIYCSSTNSIIYLFVSNLTVFFIMWVGS